MTLDAGLVDRLRMFAVFVQETVAQTHPLDAARPPAAGGFSLVEHVCHLRDYDDEGCVGRIARMIAEDTPDLPDFAGHGLACDRRYREQDLASALQAFVANRARTIDVIAHLSAADLARTASLGSTATITVADLIELVVRHDADHRREMTSLVRELDINQLRAMAAAFGDAFNAGDVDGLMRFYGDSYVDVNLRRPVQSFSERRAYFARLMQRGGTRIDVTPDEILVEGLTAFVRGRIDVRLQASESPEPTRELRYLEIARKGEDGSWKAIWGIDGPVQDA
jgi:ketosteroid isomerase-like protein